MACSLKVTPFLSFIVKVHTVPDFVATNPAYVGKISRCFKPLQWPAVCEVSRMKKVGHSKIHSCNVYYITRYYILFIIRLFKISVIVFIVKLVLKPL